MFSRFSRASAATVLSAMLAACSSGSSPESRFAGETMGTTYTVKVVGEFDAARLQTMEREVAAALGRIDGGMSTYIDDSELSRINRLSSSDWSPVSDELFAVLSEALTISRMTDGAFDVTVGPLVNLWGFGPDDATDKPSDARIHEVMATVGWRRLELREEPAAVRKRRGDVYIDLSAIAKGYAADAVAEVLARHGATDFLIEIGGDLRAEGRSGDGEPWRIGIEHPAPGRRTVHRVVSTESGGVATSGDYRNFREIEGRRYSHAIDPHTGHPAEHGTVSVTVVATTAMRADALATALIVLGADKGMALAEREGVAAYFIEWHGDELVARHSTAMDKVLSGRAPDAG